MGDRASEQNLLQICKGYLKQKYAKPGNVFLGVVSRLDTQTSGVMVFARTSKGAGRLSAQFRQRQVVKRYLAVVEGHAPESGAWLDHVRKNDAVHCMQVMSEKNAGAKLAALSFQRLAKGARTSLVDVELQTGRKHQIRVQFGSRGHPVLGDRKYGGTRSFRTGIALHSYLLQLEHPVKKCPLKFCAPPPGNWPFFTEITGHLASLTSNAE